MKKNELISSKGERISFRNDVLQEDISGVREVIASTGFFTLKEIEIAVALVQERLENGFKGCVAKNSKKQVGGRKSQYLCRFNRLYPTINMI